MTDAMTGPLRQYLQEGRDAMLRVLDGLGEYDARRPLTPSGTNILGLVKHLLGVERSYLGECVGRTPGFSLPWEEDGSIWEGADMWLRVEESREYVAGLYHQAWQHSDASIKELPLDTEAYVHWWKEGRRCPSFGSLITRVVAETADPSGASPNTVSPCRPRCDYEAVAVGHLLGVAAVVVSYDLATLCLDEPCSF